MSAPSDPAPGPAARMVACPACGKRALYAPENPWRPFCSERCRLTDLGGWASESFRIPEANRGRDPDSPEESEK